MSQPPEHGMTKQLYQQATSDYLTLEQAVQTLKDTMVLRSIKEVLATYVLVSSDEPKQMKAELVEKLMQTMPQSNRDSVVKKVGGWLAKDVYTIKKESAIQLCFAFKLSITEAETFLIKVCQECFHWRNPSEIVFLFALMTGMSYAKAVDLHDQCKQKGLFQKTKVEDAMVYTQQIKERLHQVSSVEELESFLDTARKELGVFHNTAYHLFMDFLNLLKHPHVDDLLPDDQAVSIRDIMEDYFHDRVMPRSQRGSESALRKPVFSDIQRNIRQYWPDETTLSRMMNRQVDVTRKVLILLFVATDGSDSDYETDTLDEQTSQDLFEDMHERLNLMLSDCGFAPLDARMPFDWMILYCMCAEDAWFVDNRVEQFLTTIFSLQNE